MSYEGAAIALLARIADALDRAFPVEVQRVVETESQMIPHNGKKCPVELSVFVDVELRGGDLIERCAACNLLWIHGGLPYDIVAYRVVG